MEECCEDRLRVAEATPVSGTGYQLGLVGCEVVSQSANPGLVCLVPVFRIGLGGHLQDELLEAFVDHFLGWGGVVRVVGPEPINQLAAPPMGGDGHG